MCVRETERQRTSICVRETGGGGGETERKLCILPDDVSLIVCLCCLFQNDYVYDDICINGEPVQIN